MFAHLARMLRAHDPLAHPDPVRDPRLHRREGIHAARDSKCYGFAPVKFDKAHEVNFSAMYHGDDERVPVDGVKWGLRVLYDAVLGFCR